MIYWRLDTDIVKYQLLGYGVSQTTVRSPALLLFVVVQGLALGPINNLSPQALGVTSLALDSLLNFLEYPGHSHKPAGLVVLDILQQCSLQSILVCEAASSTIGHHHELVHHDAGHVTLGQVGQDALLAGVPFEELRVLDRSEHHVIVAHHRPLRVPGGASE